MMIPKAKLASLFALALAGCDGIPKARTEAEIRRIAAEVVAIEAARNQRQIAELEQKVAKLEADLAFQARYAKAISADLDSVAGRVSNNARVANQNVLRDMTARGACGTETVRYPDGGVSYRNKACTLRDLR